MWTKEVLAESVYRSFCCVLIGLPIGGIIGGIAVALT